MLQISPLLKFIIYLLFVGGAVTYLTKNNLDEKSRYILICVLILPYIFMDQMYNYTEVSTFSEYTKQTNQDIKQDTLENTKQNVISNIDSTMKVQQNVENIENINVTYEEEMKKQQLIKKTKNVIENFDNQMNNQNNNQNNNQMNNQNNNQNNKQNNNQNNNKLVKKETYSSDDISQIITMLQNMQNNQMGDSNASLQPLGQNGDGYTNSWDQDYVILNTNKWAPSLNPPPVCKAEKECPVCPSITSGYPLSLKEFDSTRRITPPINADIQSMNS